MAGSRLRRSLDEQPDDHRHLSHREERHRKPGYSPAVRRQDDGRDAHRQVGKAADNQQHTQSPWKESGLDDQDAEWKEPESPEHHRDARAVAAHSEKRQRQRVELRLAEHRQEVGAAQEDQRRHLVQPVGKADGGADRHQHHHQPGLPSVYVLEQVVQLQGQDEEEDIGGNAGENADPIGESGSGDMARGRRRIAWHDDGPGDVEVAEGARDGQQQIHQTGLPGFRLGRAHA